MRQFADETTLHGLPKVLRASNSTKRLVWSLLFTASVAAMLFQASELIGQFLSFRKSASVDVVQSAIDFPMVTICSENALRLSVQEDIATHLKRFDLLTLLHPDYNVATHLNIEQYGNDGDCNSSECNFKRSYLDWFSNTISTALLFDFENYKIDNYVLAANLGFNLTTSVGHHIEDFLYGCKYEGKYCENDDFVVFRHPRHLMCHSFKKKTRTIAKVGQKKGLKLILKYSLMSNMLRGMALLLGIHTPETSPGFRIFVHAPGTSPFSDGDGTVFYPGIQASIGFTKTVYDRIGPPYGHCTSNSTLSRHDERYSSRGCLAEKQQDITRSLCNCTDISLPHRSGDLGRFPFCRTLHIPTECTYNASFWHKVKYHDPQTAAHIPEICLVTIKTFFDNMDCVANVTSAAHSPSTIEQNTGVHCYPPCKQFKYELRTTTNVWPTRDGFYQTLGQMITGTTNGNVTDMVAYMQRWAKNDRDSQLALDEFRSSFLQVDVFLSDGDVTTNSEHVAYEWYQMLSEFGGLLGLYIGMSLMTLGELLELLILKLYDLFNARFSDRVHVMKADTK